MKLTKADQYFLQNVRKIIVRGDNTENSRTIWEDTGERAESRYITNAVMEYDINKGEFPINTYRTTALEQAFYDIEAIFIKQTNRIADMHPSIHSWWIPFVVNKEDDPSEWHIGQTYGHTVARYDLMNKLLYKLQHDPFNRRKIIDLWQEQQMEEDPKALVPCCKETIWEVRDGLSVRYIDQFLNQRSQDYLLTASINPAQYTMLLMMVCGHLNFHTDKVHRPGKLTHHVSNLHLYDRHLPIALDLIKSSPVGIQPTIELLADKDFYSYTWEDFKVTMPEGIKRIKRPPMAV